MSPSLPSVPGETPYLAGKGRSGTLACAYLLSACASPSASIPSSLHDDWSLLGDREGLQTPSEDTSSATIDRPPASGTDLFRVSSEPVNTLEQVLHLHTSRRMKPSLHPSRHPDVPKKPKMGVSIPSQQRWLSYWLQVLDGKGPPSLRSFPDETLLDKTPQIIKLTKLTIRMREPSRIQPHLVQAASAVITTAGKGRAMSESTTGRLWASLARYSDRLVDELEHWEKESRGPAGSSPFKNDRWDKSKMIRSFAHLGMSDIEPTQESDSVCTTTFHFDLF
jgi:phosphatidylinositol-3,4,5-trisphosphate 3-phosphatase/dual-specificity protein phosphatase PTEN